MGAGWVLALQELGLSSGKAKDVVRDLNLTVRKGATEIAADLSAELQGEEVGRFQKGSCPGPDLRSLLSKIERM